MDPRRFYSALVFIPLLYLGIRYSPPWLFSLLISTVALFALWEFLALYFADTSSVSTKVLSCLLATLLLGAMHKGLPEIWLVALLGIVAIIVSGFFISPANTKQRLPGWAAYIFGVLYVGLLLGHYALLRNLEHGVALVFFVIIVTWLSDTGGFFVGKTLGKHPLAPTLSPKKTVEGLLGGVLFSVIGATISQFTFVPFFSVGQCIMLGVGLALLGALGDLAESAIKRSVSVKDSGTIIPGHGGVLDRVDSLLFTGPAMYYYVMFSLPS
ncbi:MAG: phosphatidate cytidylyltransferase [Nitrospirae bacterium]|nr:phosphatidate cytidylyltransferase [Nitrospirota bacterium]